MYLPETFVLAELRRVTGSRRLLADTSALICLDALGLLETVRHRWRLLAITEVLAEWQAGNARALELEILSSFPGEAELPTDRKLVNQAKVARLPLLSEDRRILLAAEESGLPAICCLWLVAGLDSLGDLPRPQSLAARTVLAYRFRYDAKRLGIFDQMLMLIDKGET